VRRQLLDSHRSTNYACVDLPLIESLYRREYAERVSGVRRLFMPGASRLRTVQEAPSGVRVEVVHKPTRRVRTRLRCRGVRHRVRSDAAAA
jgi:L-ornithine N5-oxygenase